MKTRHKIIVLGIVVWALVTVIVPVITLIWGQSNPKVYVEIKGQTIVLDNENIQRLAAENEDLKISISNYQSEIADLKLKSDNLESKLENASGELQNAAGELEKAPVLEFRDLGFSIDGEDMGINRDKSFVYINGIPYYGEDFVRNLLPSNMTLTIKYDTIYAGKIVREKAKLFDMEVVKKTDYCGFHDTIKDTYGNIYGKSFFFDRQNTSITFNTQRGYSHLKCTAALINGSSQKGIIRIKGDHDEIIYTSPEITNMTEAFPIDIPINQASTITIEGIGDGNWNNVFITDAILYNQE